MTPKQLAGKIKKFRPYPPITDSFEGALRKRERWGTKPVWYVSQKQHWLGWLSEYDSPGYYGRKNRGQSAGFAYNHIMCPPMLLWLAEASGVAKKKVIEANKAALQGDFLCCVTNNSCSEECRRHAGSLPNENAGGLVLISMPCR